MNQLVPKKPFVIGRLREWAEVTAFCYLFTAHFWPWIHSSTPPALAGLQDRNAINVHVELDCDADANQISSADALVARVKDKLRAAGISVVTTGSPDKNTLAMLVQVTTVRLNNVRSCNIDAIEVAQAYLREDTRYSSPVVVDRQAVCALVGRTNLTEAADQSIDTIVDKFISDYRKANP